MNDPSPVTPWRELLDLSGSPVAVAFLPEPPPGVARIGERAPSTCSYWRRASRGETFYTTAEDHLGCPIGALTHGVELPSETAEELDELVEMMVNRDTQPGEAQAIYNTLMGLGAEAVPALIKHMDDRRRLVIPKITLYSMDPDGFEGLIHYGPDVVTDLMSVVLTRITQQDLTQIYNGGTELERQNAVRIWKVYERRRKKAL